MSKQTLIISMHKASAKAWASKRGLLLGAWQWVEHADYLRGRSSRATKLIWLDDWLRRSDVYELIEVARPMYRSG